MQMLRGGIIILMAIVSKVFLKMELKNYHYFGCVLAIIGVAIVGASNFLFPKAGIVEHNS